MALRRSQSTVLPFHGRVGAKRQSLSTSGYFCSA